VIKEQSKKNTASFASENDIRSKTPRILDILLLDRTTSTQKVPKNIIWANENYIKYGLRKYAATSQIKPELITGNYESLIMPRALKTKEQKKQRTKSKAEVFTPLRIVKKQNDIVDKNIKNDNLESYIKYKWLEITCGEAPYMATRYDMETGKFVPLKRRVGFLDRKLMRINSEISDKAVWQTLVESAFKASYGFEWNGDSLLLARENLLYTYCDYYFEKWCKKPGMILVEKIAEIISYNVFQMDGQKYIIPLSEKKVLIEDMQFSMFEPDEPNEKWRIIPGRRVKIMNWDTKKMEFFDKGVKKT